MTEIQTIDTEKTTAAGNSGSFDICIELALLKESLQA